jgi:EAL domain-containing protein (putative c-di-GMP-specific phosphodiesterase class I)
MYDAKQAGKNQYSYFAESMNAQVSERLQIEAQLRAALEREELLLYYQPRVSLPEGRIQGAEGLARWQHPERGLLSPGAFLPVAERSTLIGDIDRYVLNSAAAQAAHWHAAGIEFIVSLNLSARDLHRDGFGADVAATLERFAAAPAAIELEITESMVMQDVERATRQLRDLKERAPGLRVAMDDFGSGYSSMQYLRQLPIDTLKIDRSFVMDLDTAGAEQTARAIAKTIVELGHNLGLHVIAEGVETQAQADTLYALGCTAAQGFWFHHPYASDHLEARLP